MNTDLQELSRLFIRDQANEVLRAGSETIRKAEEYLHAYPAYFGMVPALWAGAIEGCDSDVIRFLTKTFDALTFSCEFRRRASLDRLLRLDAWEGVPARDVSNLSGGFLRKAVLWVRDSKLFDSNQQMTLLSLLQEAFGVNGRVRAEFQELEVFRGALETNESVDCERMSLELFGGVIDAFVRSCEAIYGENLIDVAELGDLWRLITLKEYLRFEGLTIVGLDAEWIQNRVQECNAELRRRLERNGKTLALLALDDPLNGSQS